MTDLDRWLYKVTVSSSLEKATRITIDALNESHKKHGIEDVMRCKFCASMAAEMTIARHFAPVFDEIEQLRKRVTDLDRWLYNDDLNWRDGL